jgi:hypothetical protein
VTPTGSQATQWLLYKTQNPTTGETVLIAPFLVTRLSKMRFLPVSLSLLTVLSAFAAPNHSRVEKRQIQTLSPQAIAAFKPYTFFAAAAYCDPSALKMWTCGGMWRGYDHGDLGFHYLAHCRGLRLRLWFPTHRNWRRRSRGTILYVFTSGQSCTRSLMRSQGMLATIHPWPPSLLDIRVRIPKKCVNTSIVSCWLSHSLLMVPCCQHPNGYGCRLRSHQLGFLPLPGRQLGREGPQRVQ